MANRYWVGGSGTWDNASTANWSATSGGAAGASYPTGSDDVFFDANSGTGTATISTGAVCRNLNCTGYTGEITGTTTLRVNGSMLLSAGMTYSHTGTVYFTGDTAGATLNTAGQVFSTLQLGTSVGGGALTLASNLNTSSRGIIVTGDLNTNGYSVTTGTLQTIDPVFGTPTLILGSSSVTINPSAGGTAVLIATQTTLSATSSTITINGTSSTFSGGNKAFGTVVFGGTGTLTISGSNSFASLKNSTAPATLTFTAGTTQTITSFEVSGTSGNLVTINSTSSTRAVLSKPTPWYVGRNSVDGGNNLNLTFVDGDGIDYLSFTNIQGLPAPTGSGFMIFFT